MFNVQVGISNVSITSKVINCVIDVDSNTNETRQMCVQYCMCVGSLDYVVHKLCIKSVASI